MTLADKRCLLYLILLIDTIPDVPIPDTNRNNNLFLRFTEDNNNRI